MHIEILTEDKSGALVVKRLVDRMVADEGVSADVSVRPHRGCGSLPNDLSMKPPRFASALLDLLPAKCRAYNSVYRGTDNILIVIMDSDDRDPKLLRRRLYDVCHMCAPDIRSVIGLCTEEIEAWLLGDLGAVIRAYPDCDIKAYDKYVQDSICGTWEHLCRIVCPENYDDILEIGYPAIGHYKAKWAENISEYMDPQRNLSPSFNNFRMSLITALRKPGVVKGQFPIRHTRTF